MLGRETAVSFSSAPKFGNALCYSESDMVALTTEHLIYILPMNLGNTTAYDVIHKKDRVNRDIGTTRDVVFPSVLPDEANKYSIHTFRYSAWSPRGAAPNGGCLLATTATDGRVTVYRPPAIADSIMASQRWIEVADLYEPLLEFCKKEEFKKGMIGGETSSSDARKGKRKSDQANIEVYITGAEAIRRTHMLETLCLCWSPAFSARDDSSKSHTTSHVTELFLVLGGKSKITIWKCRVPPTPPFTYYFHFSASISTDGQWISAMSWKGSRLGVAFTDGSVRVWEVTKVHESQPTITQITQVPSDMVYPSGMMWVEDALWVAKGHSLLKINNKGNLLEKGEHTTIVKAMCRCSSTNQVITLAEDGTIRAWDAETCKLIWERESDFSRRNLGWHGIATSPFGRYIIALEQISGVYDQMYKARNATGKFWTIPTGDPRPIVDLILLQVERGDKESMWDLVQLLRSERDSNILMRITDALENYYYKERQANEPKPQVQALCVANVLYETVEYVEDKTIKENIRERLQKNITEVISRYILTVFQNFKVAEKRGGEDFVLQLTEREVLCLKNMYQWIESFAPQLKPAATDVEKHVAHTMISEMCPFCKQPVPFTSHASDKCTNGHALLRCTRTFLALGSHVLWHNSFTSTKSLIFNFEREDVTQAREFKWLLEGGPTFPLCPLYHVPFMRFPPSLLDKLDQMKDNKD